MLSCSPQHLDAAIRPLMAAEAVRKNGKIIYLDAQAVYLAAKQYAERVNRPAISDDPLLAGVDSPQLERYRSAKASLAEMDLEERKKTHANINDLESALVRYASMVRRGGEILQRRFGNDASDILNSAIDEAEQIVKASIVSVRSKPDSDGDQPGQ